MHFNWIVDHCMACKVFLNVFREMLILANISKHKCHFFLVFTLMAVQQPGSACLHYICNIVTSESHFWTYMVIPILLETQILIISAHMFFFPPVLQGDLENQISFEVWKWMLWAEAFFLSTGVVAALGCNFGNFARSLMVNRPYLWALWSEPEFRCKLQ